MPMLAKQPDAVQARLAAMAGVLDKQADALAAVAINLQRLSKEIAGLKEWVETAVNRPWALAAGAPKGRDDDDLPF